MLEPPVAAPDHAELILQARICGESFPETKPSVLLVKLADLAGALLAERQQDKERIERLEVALEKVSKQDSYEPNVGNGWATRLHEAGRIARATLAGEEDTARMADQPQDRGSAANGRENRRHANERLLEAIKALWCGVPDQRFGQLVMNLSRIEGGFADTWEWSNADWLRKIEEGMRTWAKV